MSSTASPTLASRRSFDRAIATLAADSGVLRCQHGDRLVALYGRGVAALRWRLVARSCDQGQCCGWRWAARSDVTRSPRTSFAGTTRLPTLGPHGSPPPPSPQG